MAPRRTASEPLRHRRILVAAGECAVRLLEPGNWDAQAPAALAVLGQALDASRVLLFENHPGQKGEPRMSARYEWSAPGVESQLWSARVQGLRLVGIGAPPWEPLLRSGRYITQLIRALPLEQREGFESAGIRSLALVPIAVSGEWWGNLSLHDCVRDRSWPTVELEAIQVAASCFGAAVERQRAERALRESEARFKDLTFASFEGVALTENGVFLDANPQLCTMLGRELNDLLGRHVLDFVAPEDRERVKHNMVLRLEGPYSHLVLRKDGSRFPVEIRAKAIPYHGRIVRVTTLLDTSERVKAEEALRSSEKKYRDIFEFAPLGIAQTLPDDGTVITANNALAKLIGYSDSREILGLKLPQGDPESESNAEVPVDRRDGQKFWAQVTSHAVKDGSGRVQYVESFISDITNRKAAEDALRESEERHRRVFYLNPIPMVIYELGTLRILAVNNAAVELYGYPEEEFLELPVTALYFPEDIPRVLSVQTADRPVLEHRGIRRHRRKDGSVREVDCTSLALNFESKSARLVVAHDVTDQRRLQAVVEHAAHVWRQTFDAADPALLILDKDTRVIRLNRSAQDLLGRNYQEIVGNPLAGLSPQEPWPTACATHAKARSSAESQTAQAHDPTTGCTWELTVKPLPFQGDEGSFILSVHDITRLVELQESLRHTEMMSALGGLVAGVAHEVRNPLFSISATLDNLEGHLSTNPDFVQYAALLRSQVARLSHLMRDLLDYGKPARLQITSSKPADLIRRAARSCALLARERGVTIDEEPARRLPELQVDAARMLQVFENLISNAIQHSARGGHVRVTAERGESDVIFRVEDSGRGIPPEDLHLLFDPFFSRRKEGTGLGLSIAQRIVDAHRGRISAANRQERGAVFSVSIPCSGDQANHAG